MPAPQAGGHDTQARTPVIVVTTDDIEHEVRRLLTDPAYDSSGYSESYEYKKTDISGGVAQAVTGSRGVLGGDVLALGGWCLRETTGAAAAAVRIHDGSTANNELLATIGIPSATSSIVIPRGKGIEVSTGKLFLAVVSGSVEGVLYWR